MSKWIKINTNNKIKIELYSKNPFWDLLLTKDIKYSFLAKDYANYLNKIKDDIEILTLFENTDNVIERITKYLTNNTLSIDYIKNKYRVINENNVDNNKLNFPIILEDDKEDEIDNIRNKEILFKLSDSIITDNKISYDTYILPFLLPVNSWWNINWTLFCFSRKTLDDYKTIYDKFIYLNNDNLDKEKIIDFWIKIKIDKIFNNIDSFCDYRFFDIDLIKKYSEEIEDKHEKSYDNNENINNPPNTIKSWDIKDFISFTKSLITLKWGISNILMNYKDSIDWNDFSSHDREKHILWLVKIDELKQRDYKRYIHGTVPFANYVFTSILDSWEKEITLQIDYLDELNPFRQKYKDKNIDSAETKFECLRDYINENSFALDAAAIWWMAWATDFVQLYKYVMMEEIIKKEYRNEIIKKLFEVLKSDNIENFIKNYDEFIGLLKLKNTNDDKRLSRLYNRLYFIFSFILNNLKPEIFPIYFSATRNTLRTFWIEWYQNVVKIYKKIIKDKDLINYIDEYLIKVWIDKEKYWFKDIKELPFNIELFKNHSKYRFFQDLCWVINRNILDGQDYVNNLWKWQKFNYEELKNKIYFFEKIEDSKWDNSENFKQNWSDEKNKKITFWEIINIDYLLDEWYISKTESWEYEVIKTDTYFIRDKKDDKKTEETN